MTRWWREFLFLIPAWFAIGLIGWIALSITSVRRSPDVQSLAGPWSAEIHGPDGTSQRELYLPGLTNRQGVPTEARVVARRDVHVDAEGPLALWIDSPFYAVQARWDGLPVGASGDPDAFGPADRTEVSLLVILPESVGRDRHTLELVTRGDFGKAGITGEILVGPADWIVRAASIRETQHLALALGLSLLAFLPLAVAANHRSPAPYLFYGLFSTALALHSYSLSDAAASWVGHGLAIVRMHRLAEGPMGPLVIAFLASFIYGRLDRVHVAFLVFGAGSALAGLVVPSGWLYRLELLQDASLLCGVPWFLFLLVQAVRRQVQGAWLLASLTSVPVAAGIVAEVMLSHGLRGGNSHLYDAALFLVGGTGAALMVRDALASSRHERLVSGSVDAMLVCDADLRVADANPAALRLLGPIVDHNLLESVEAEDHPMVRAHLTRAATTSDRAEFRLHLDREVVVESLATPLEAGVVLLVLRDATQRKQVDRGLLHAARLETVGLLLGGIAHDFNNMLGTLLAHAGWLQARLVDEASLDRVARMEATIDRAAHLTRRLLTIARGSSAELGPVDLAAVCRNAVELVEPTLGGSVGLELDLPPELPPVHGDAGELEQVLVNLLVNARDALDRGGRIRLGVRAFELDDGARGVCVMVEDNGPGVPEAIRDSIFQPFVTTKGSGTGLGLAVASQVARDHHGRIWYEDRPEGGARFLLALRHADAVDEAPAPLPARRSVLLVEDERVLLEDYSNALRQAGYDVVAMGDPTSAASWLLDHPPDILVTDVVMEGLSGIELATLCSHRYPEVPVLLVSGFIPDDTLAYSTWHRLHKPLRAARLVATVGSLRRRAERAAVGDADITHVTWLFPTLGDLSAARVGFR